MIDGEGLGASMSSLEVSPWGERATARWGHHGPTLLSASILAVIALGLHPPTGPFALTVPLALVVFILTTWLCMRQHDRRLCELCVSAMPLDVAERAERYQRRFWVAHCGTQPRYLIPYLTVLIGSDFLPGSPGRVVWALAQSSMIYLIASYSAHRRLQPWCPWCRGDGGGGAPEQAPTPTPEHHRQLT
jgi:hypothetical protein